jgi:hypothetical protein
MPNVSCQNSYGTFTCEDTLTSFEDTTMKQVVESDYNALTEFQETNNEQTFVTATEQSATDDHTESTTTDTTTTSESLIPIKISNILDHINESGEEDSVDQVNNRLPNENVKCGSESKLNGNNECKGQ